MRSKAFFINGGAGRVICSIPAFEKYAETHDDFIIVCEGGTDFYKGHPVLHKHVYDNWHKGLFEKEIKHRDCISPEPYRNWHYYNQKASLAQAFDIIINELDEPRELPKPVAAPYTDIELNQENYDHWSNANTNLCILIDALENGNPTVNNENKTATFETPVEFADGVTQIEFGFPDDTFEDYLQYLKDTDGYQKELLVRLKTHLGISTT